MGEITKEKADAILAPFTIDPERAEYVEFSNPYKFKGISILVKRVNNLDLSIWIAISHPWVFISPSIFEHAYAIWGSF